MIRSIVYPCLVMVILASCYDSKPSLSSDAGNWYEKGFYFLHFDHHVREDWEMGKDTDPDQVRRVLRLARPDMISLITKGNTGYTTYPTDVGFRPPHYYRDMVAVYRDAAAEMGIPFVAYYNPGRDKYIMDHKPEWNKVGPDGKLYDRAICYNTPVVDEYLWPQIAEIMDRYHPAGFWLDGTFPHHFPCYHEHCKEDFRRRTGLEPPSSADSPSFGAYKAYHREQWRQFIHTLAVRIHARDPGCLIACAAAWCLSMPEKPDPEFAWLSNDFSWPDNMYPYTEKLRFWDSQGLPYDIMTTIFTQYGGKRVLKPFAQLEQEMAAALANGARFYAWDNPTPSSGLEESHVERMGRLSSWLRSRQPYCLRAASMPDVSVLHIAESHYKKTDDRTRLYPGPVDISSICRTVSRLHMHAEVIADWRLLEGPVRGSLLVVNNPMVIPEAVMRALGDFARSGGTVLLTAGASNCGGAGFRDLSGVEFVSVESKTVRLTIPGSGIQPVRARWYLVQPTGAEVVIAGQDGTPFLTRSKLGRGTVWYCATPFLEDGGDLQHPDAFRGAVLDLLLPQADRRVTATAPEWVEISLRRQGNRTIVHLVNMALGDRPEAGSKYIENIPAAPPCSVSVRVRKRPAFVTLEPGGREPEHWEYHDGMVTVKTGDFHIHEMVVLTFSQ